MKFYRSPNKGRVLNITRLFLSVQGYTWTEDCLVMQDSLAVLQHPKVDVVISPQRPLIKKKEGFIICLIVLTGRSG